MFEATRIMIGKRREYRRNAKLSREEYGAMKLAKFRQLVAHANNHSPYYQKVIAEREIQTTHCTPEDFPILSKTDLMKNFDDIVTDKAISKKAIADFLSHSTDPNDLFLNKYRIIHTSGSSGEMGYFPFSPGDWARGTSATMRAPLPGSPAFDRKKRIRKGKIRMAYFAAISGHFAGVSLVSALSQGIARFFLNTELYEVNEPMADTVSGLNEFQPDVLVGYTGALLLLASQQQAGKLNISPQLINTAGEGMSGAERTILESTFGGAASNGYASSEHLMMGLKIPTQSRMVLFDDDLIFDLREDCTLVSNMFNMTLPLIRYQMSDILKPVDNKSFPDMPYPEIESLIGRTETMPVFINDQGEEDTLHPITIAEIFVAGVLRFQLRWLSKNSFTFLVCLDSALDPENKAMAIATTRNRLEEILHQKNMGKVSFDVLEASALEVNETTRKFQLIVNNNSL